jgi:hypothetical protein
VIPTGEGRLRRLLTSGPKDEHQSDQSRRCTGRVSIVETLLLVQAHYIPRRKGLFIIDLNAPLEIPRFLPQGGTWDVADVQWNPHVSHARYIVSTSNEKLSVSFLHVRTPC